MTLPLQPLQHDVTGVLGFRPNALVLHLMEYGSIDMDQLARVPAPQEDREQFAQLIGTSLSAFGDYPYVSEVTKARAKAMAADLDNPSDPREAHIQALESELARLRGILAGRTQQATIRRGHPSGADGINPMKILPG